jgi:hypothetical protein
MAKSYSAVRMEGLIVLFLTLQALMPERGEWPPPLNANLFMAWSCTPS